MPSTASITASVVGNDPLALFLRSRRGDERHPIPLVATHIAVTIRGGLASVTTERTFRNAEQASIEATMTFPVPVDATLCALSARIDGRVLHAQAKARAEARGTYEEAVDSGKAAALHEELLKGIHMLSVAHVRPGAEIVVTDTWTAPLSFIEGTPRLHIPTTVGEIYGRSPLAPSDDIIVGPDVHPATIAVACENGSATVLRAGPANGGRAPITLDAPIDIVVSGWTRQSLEGIAADGRRVTLDVEPAPATDAPLDIDLLFDRSGSMGELVTGAPEVKGRKIEVAKAGLRAAVRQSFGAGDKMRLWEFDDTVRRVGEAKGADCRQLVDGLREAGGGTEIGLAFNAVLAANTARNVVIVTDGKSWAFDPQRVARAGIRLTAVLIGEDALEAGIAHLAGMTGGQAFIATGAEAGSAIGAAIAAARAPCIVPEPIAGAPSHLVTLRRGARIVTVWGEPTDGVPTAEERQVGATAAMLAIPLMADDEAATLAEAEGIVCHLTSLVLVDQAGERQQALPARRSVPLSAPAGAPVPCAAPMAAAPRFRTVSPAFDSAAGAPRPGSSSRRIAHCEARPPKSTGSPIRPGSSSSPIGGRGLVERLLGLGRRSGSKKTDEAAPVQQRTARISLARIGRQIDWEADPEALRQGDVSGIPNEAATAILQAAQLPAIDALANELGIDPVQLVIALLARTMKFNRSAQRIARTILDLASGDQIRAATHEIGL